MRHPSVQGYVQRIPIPFRSEKPAEEPASDLKSTTPVEIPTRDLGIQDYALPDFDQIIPALPACKLMFPSNESEFDACGMPTPLQKVLRIGFKLRDFLSEKNVRNDHTRILLIDEKDDGYHRHVLNFLIYPAYVEFRFGAEGATESERIKNAFASDGFDYLLILDKNPELMDPEGKAFEALSMYELKEGRFSKCWQF
jgi:hypothetical protein